MSSALPCSGLFKSESIQPFCNWAFLELGNIAKLKILEAYSRTVMMLDTTRWSADAGDSTWSAPCHRVSICIAMLASIVL